MDISELKQKSSLTLRKCDSIKDLDAFILEIKSFVKNKWLDKENRSIFESMLCKLQIKKYLLLYYENKYKEIDYINLIKCLDLVIELATNKEYNSTLILAQNYKTTINDIHPLVNDLSFIKSSMYDENGFRLIRTTIGYKNILETISNKMIHLNEIENLPLFPNNVNILSPLEHAKKELKLLGENAKKSIDLIYKENEKKYLNDILIDIINVFKEQYMFYPDINLNINDLKVVILNTPLINESRFLIYKFMLKYNLKFSILNCNSLNNMQECEINELFNLLVDKKINCLIENMNNLVSDTKNTLIKNIIIANKKGIHIIINDNIGNNALYNEIIEKYKETNISFFGVGSIYLSIPNYDDVIELLISEEMIDASDVTIKTKIKESLPFIGFIGLNEIYRAYISKRDWFKVGEKISNENYCEQLEIYLNNITDQSLLIDRNWGIFKK